MTWVARKLNLWWLKQRANAMLIFKRGPQALRAYQDVLAADAGQEEARLILATLYADGGDEAAAVAEIKRLLEINPSRAEAWFNLGYLHDKAERVGEAEACFRRAVELKPSIDRAWYGLGLVLIRQKRLPEAVAALERNIKLQPFSPYGYYQLGLTLHHLGRVDEAWDVHRRLAEFEPRFSATLKRDLERMATQMNEIQPTIPLKREETDAIAT